MATTSSDISTQIQNQLKVLIPDLSVDPLTPERKIVDSVADVLASGNVSVLLQNYALDIDTKVGTDLDNFVALFGFARQGGRRATGLVTLSRQSTSIDDIVIPTGTTIIKPATSVSGVITFITTAVGILPAGGTSVEVPITCADAGAAGNVPAGTISQITGGSATSVSTVNNENATSGGTNQETDAELRVRFKNTIFRNVAGTQDQFLALAIATNFASKANVIGPQSRFIEYTQIKPDLTITSIIPYSKYTYPFDFYLTNGDLNAEIFYEPGGVDYSFSVSVPPVINVQPTSTIGPGDVLLLEHTYCSKNSRNDPFNGLANNIDVYVNGVDTTTAIETVSFPASTTAFNNTPASSYYLNNYLRAATSATPLAGNYLQELLWQPVYNLPAVITINGVDYYEGTHYWQVRDMTVYKGSKRSRDGIEWSTSVISQVASGTQFTLNYVFNKLPIILNELMDRYKMITTDVLVHAATNRYFNVNLVVMYTPGFSKSSVDAALSAALISYMNSQQFGALLQLSDLLEIAHEVPGVDNIRLAVPGDGVGYGVQEVATDGVTLLGSPYTSDFTLQDSDLPVVNAVITTQRSQNTWNGS